VLVRTARHAMLYDAGPAVPGGWDAGERVVVPALHALGVRALDTAVVSHAVADRAGGLAAVRRRFPPRHLLAPARSSIQPADDSGGLAAVRRRFPPRHLLAPDGSGIDAADACLAGSGWERDGVRFRLLHPPLHFPYLRNEASCVLRVDTAHGALLLPGDIGEAVEERLAGRIPGELAADVVLVPHHGSRHSSTPGFVAASAPRLALVSAGHGNRFGHPDAGAVARWEAAGAAVLGTAGEGALRLRLAPGGPEVEGERRRRPRFWDAGRVREPPGARSPGRRGAILWPLSVPRAPRPQESIRAGTGQGGRLADAAAAAALGGGPGDHRRAVLDAAPQPGAPARPGPRGQGVGGPRRPPRTRAHRVPAQQLPAGRAAGRRAGHAPPPARRDARARG